jgi:selenide,water dikinase
LIVGPDIESRTGERLTSFSHGAGCACKLSPTDLDRVMRLVSGFGAHTSPDLLVGLGTSDDAAVYRMSADQALVFTTDFFTPIVDDAYDWGRIAATNALSDVYAMGGTPLMALNLVAWPREALPMDMLARVIEGGLAVAESAGCLVVGGHSIDDAEPKYGMAVVGTVHPDRVLANDAAQLGDVLVLTKPLGIGAITTATKRQLAPPDVLQTAIDTMTTLNRSAMEAAAAVGIGGARAVHAATDVTGFGLLGHAAEMAAGSNVSIAIDPRRVPIIDGARQLVAAGIVSGGTRRNHEWLSSRVDWTDTSPDDQVLLVDAQTSGGLLLACAPDAVDDLIAELRSRRTLAADVVGTVGNGTAGHIVVSS